MKRLSELEQQINNTGLLSQPAASRSSSAQAGPEHRPKSTSSRSRGLGASQQQGGRAQAAVGGAGRSGGGSQEARSASCRLAVPWPAAGPGEGASHCKSGGRAASVEPGPPPRGRNRAERHAGGWTEAAAGGQGLAAGREGSSRTGGQVQGSCLHLAASGAEPRGWPRGGDMLTFRDSSWYQSGNSDVVRDRQTESQQEKESRPGPGAPFLPASTPGGGQVAL